VTSQVGPGTKAFVAAFLAAFVTCGLLGVEAWPLSGWELFSRVRTEARAGWEAVTVDRSGAEHPIPFARLPRGMRGELQVMAGFPSLPPAEREAVCGAWAGAVRERGGEVAAVRVYRVVRSRRDGRELERQLAYECARQAGR
jgi:hypothetical protein